LTHPDRKLPLCLTEPPPGGRKCNDCDLAAQGRVNCFPGKGPGGGIMIIGESPTLNDRLVDEPFSERAGNKLDYLLEKAGFDRTGVYLTYAVKCQVREGKKPTVKQMDACQKRLYEEILYFKPKVIMTLGSVPLKTLVPTVGGGPMELRGFPIKLKNKGEMVAWCLPTLSMEQCLGKPGYDPIVVSKRSSG